MSDYIFNGGNPASNNFSERPERSVLDPIEPRFKEPPKGSGGKKFMVGVCAAAILLSGAVGYGGAMLAMDDASAYAAPKEPIVVYRSVETSYPESTSLSYTDVSRLVSDSVVEIVTQYQVVSPFYQYVTGGAGSGVILSEDGYIVTNTHVIVDDNDKVVDSITVTLKSGEKYEATVVGADAETDIAVLKIEAEAALPYAVIGDSEALVVGEEVIAVGNPLGELGGTVTNGIISALDRAIDVDGNTMNLLQTNTAINPGNSGGGLFNMKGELVGIVNAKSSGTGIEGLGFAIPVDDAMEVFEQLVSYGYVKGRTYIGVNFLTINDIMTAYKYNVRDFGVYVYSTVSGYNDQALKLGDRLIGIDGQEITVETDIKALIREHEVGDVLTFTVVRNGETMDVSVTLFEATPENTTGIDFSDS